MNKLVRDKIIEIIKHEGREVDFKILNKKEYLKALKNKLKEEAQEVIESRNKKEALEELADLQELIDCILKELKINKQQLKTVQNKKNKVKGSFKKKIFLKSFK